MIDLPTLVVFVGASLALLLVPGPSVLYIVARSVSQGRGAGIVSALGVSVGNVLHVVAAAGLSVVLMSSALAFEVVKFVGAAYLIYLGIQTLRSLDADTDNAQVTYQPKSKIFRQGVVVNVLNPKTALFFLAFLPQFVNPGIGDVTLQLVLLGITFTILAIITDTFYALVSGSLGVWLRGNARAMRIQRYFAGGAYIVLGVTTALTGNDQS